jgi:hypothetical protein
MLRKCRRLLYVLGPLLFFATAPDVFAQALERIVAVPDKVDPNKVNLVVLFKNDVKKVNGKDVPPVEPGSPNNRLSLPAPSISFLDDAGDRQYLTSDIRFAEVFGVQFPLGLELFNLRPLEGGGAVPSITNERGRTYFVSWEKVQVQGFPEMSIFGAADVGSSLAGFNIRDLSGAVGFSSGEFSITPIGIKGPELAKRLKANPGRITIHYNFSANDPAPDFKEQVASVKDAGAGSPPGTVILDLGRRLPARPENYKVTVKIPVSEIEGLLEPGFSIPPDADSLTAEVTIEKLTPPTERAKTEFFFESTFTSIVNATTGDRSNVGLFGVHLKPTIRLLVYNTEDTEKKPLWLAFRPLFDGDVDTQPIKDSKAPNRVVFGFDFELGQDAGQQQGSLDLVQQLVWINGIRYDSDRDFKLQTLYWHTEFIPRFLNFEQTRDQRLRQFRFPCRADQGTGLNSSPTQASASAPIPCQVKQKQRADLFPFVSTYHIRPSIGYQLGGTINRDDRVTGFPTEKISRPFFKLSSGIELIRLFQVTVEDTYYFLENAPRRRNRNYFEGRLDFNTGALFNVDLGSLQSALTLKFQRGDLPPRFSPVNSLSLGFKLYK